MLAYVFWHWPRPGVDRSAYEQDLREFHRALATEKPSGFQYSLVFRVGNAPWLPANVDACEDWYLLDASPALDVLNEAAVSSPSKQVHDRAARSAAGGVAGLYRFRRGRIDFNQAHFAVWLSKPEGTSYEDFYALLDEITSRSGVSLWGRQMVLGPTPEFCLLTPAELSLDKEFNAVNLSLDPIWNGSE